MKSAEIVKIFLNHYHMVREKGESCEPLLPFIVMDLAYQMFDKFIKPVECRFVLKREKNNWIRNYDSFNQRMFNVFNEEQKGELIDKMDKYEEYMSHHILVARVQLMNCMPKDTLEMQQVLSACMMIRALTQIARIVWEKVYHRVKSVMNPYYREILAMESSIWVFMQAYHDSGTTITTNQSKTVDDSMQIICNKTVQWMRDN